MSLDARLAGRLAVELPTSQRPIQEPAQQPKIEALDRMSRPAVAIPEKLFFKIGEVCELAGVQAHVLRYWESEFPMLAPQKNRAGQRVYRKRDVEMALRIKELLYEDQYTIAGAKKRLSNELRGGGKLKVVGEEDAQQLSLEPSETESFTPADSTYAASVAPMAAEERQGLKQLAAELRELLALLEQETQSRTK